MCGVSVFTEFTAVSLGVIVINILLQVDVEGGADILPYSWREESLRLISL